ncbi:MAG: hypothetical protein B6D61_14810 [Bacteroidetes bacterium 4484_249]|nr:MAG: hypothetical protein B6D61_14810 [Bacteroidetes bacterium 4484_249]
MSECMNEQMSECMNEQMSECMNEQMSECMNEQLIKPDSGKIFLNGEDITQKNIQTRQTGLVFQDYAVFPHLSVRENICYPLKSNNTDRLARKEKVEELARQTDIFDLLDRKPSTLSGGELQRVALARILALEPKCLLLDEPLSSLDVELRQDLRELLRKLNGNGLTIIHVTHDYEEAVALANRVGIINEGRIIQTGNLKEVFHKPKSKFVAKLTGIKNFYNAKMISIDKAQLENKVEIATLPFAKDAQGFIMFRAEDVVLSCKQIESSLSNSLKGKIISLIPTLNGIEVTVEAGIKIASLITSQSVDKLGLKEGKEIIVNFKAAAVKFIGS